jgi:hypothetical protein
VAERVFPALESELGELSASARRLVAILELIPLDSLVPSSCGWNGRPQRNRHAIASAFVARAVCNLPRTSDLLDRLASDEPLRLICGWKRGEPLPTNRLSGVPSPSSPRWNWRSSSPKR